MLFVCSNRVRAGVISIAVVVMLVVDIAPVVFVSCNPMMDTLCPDEGYCLNYRQLCYGLFCVSPDCMQDLTN